MMTLKPLQLLANGFAFNPATGDSYSLNPCGQKIFQQLQQGQHRLQIARSLAAEFGIPPETAERDVADFLQQLQTLGLGGTAS